MAKREQKISKEVTEKGVKITFAHDDSVLEAKLSDFPDEVKLQLAKHGLSQKLGDSAAGTDIQDCPAAINAVYEALKAGKWVQRKEGAGGPRISQLAKALSLIMSGEAEQWVAKLAEMDDDAKNEIKTHPQVKAALATIRAEEAAANAESLAQAAKDAGEVPLNL